VVRGVGGFDRGGQAGSTQGQDQAGETSAVAERVEARLWILTALQGFREEQGLGISRARSLYAHAYNRGMVPVPDWVRGAVRRVSEATLSNWMRDLRESGGITDNRGLNRRKSGILDQDGEMFALAMSHIHQRPALIHGALLEQFGARCPSKRTVERWVMSWRAEHPQEFAKLTDRDLFNSRYRSSAGSMVEGVGYALEILEIDGTKTDAFLRTLGIEGCETEVLLRTKRGFKRFSLVFVIDVFSRRLKGFVCETSNSEVITQSALRWVVTNWGYVEGMTLRTDQGKDFLSNRVLAALDALGMQHHKCNGRSGWEKPFVERSFGTMTRQLMERLPGYCGHDVAERIKLRSQTKEGDVELMLYPHELQSVLDGWCEIYNNTKHGGEFLDGVKTPNERWAESPRGISWKYRENPRLLDMLLADVPSQRGLRTVCKSGIKIPGGYAINQDGEHVPYMGRRVLVRFSPWERGVYYVFSEDGQDFLFEGWDYRELDLNRKDAAARAHEVQREVLAPVKQIRRLGKRDESKVVPLSRRAEDLDFTPQQRAARAAATKKPAKQPRELSERERVRQEELVEQMKEAAKPRETLLVRFERLYRDSLLGVAMGPDDAEFLDRCLDEGYAPGSMRRIDAEVRIGVVNG